MQDYSPPRIDHARAMFRNILLVRDFSDTTHVALQYAIELALLYHSKIFVIHASPHEIAAAVQTQASRARTEEKMSVFLEPATVAGIQCEVLIETGNVFSAICDLVKTDAIDLVVAGMHEAEGASRLILGSAIEQLLRRVDCPVLTIGPQVDRERPREGELSEIIYATDFAFGSLQACPYAVSLTEEFGGHLTLVHIVSDDVPSYAREGIQASFQEQLKRMLPEDSSVSSDTIVRFANRQSEFSKSQRNGMQPHRYGRTRGSCRG